MHCPFCQSSDSRVVDTRIADDGASIRRRRECATCKKRFTTLETSSFQVVKRSGVVEPFSRDKIVSGLKQACRGRPDVTGDQLAYLAQQVEEQIRSSGVSNVSSEEVGKAILPFLRDLDEIAYLRFASVYRAFNSVEDFAQAIEELQGRKKSTQARSTAHTRRQKTPPQDSVPTLLD
ncbi:transcriptional regulator NrdR [Schaalia sp. lx-100]|uniref:transcriptional regulator NrdR n=1 Tax=Schaalia sp. lx-100 TaxID=2899081 RepID=UPI001E4F9100|nr:transcriptional regulator NrdR [Schaalia sp. lx-100]